MHPSNIPIEGFPQMDPNLPSTAAPVDVDDEEESPARQEEFEIESLESSPGSSLRLSRRGKIDMTQLEASPGALRRGVQQLEASPGVRRRGEPRLEDAPPRTPSRAEVVVQRAASRLEEAPARTPSRNRGGRPQVRPY